MSTFTTTFNSGDVPRVHNISLIAAAVHGSLVRPGQVFSMNAATGQRTAAKGYRTAHVIQNGEIVDGLGGGVCQAGTTMFNTAFFAGLPVTERRNHSLHISHYPMGRDATLNWPGTDLKFRNDSPYGIYITSRATPSTLTFTFWSTSRGYKVTSSTSAASNFRAPPTRYEDDRPCPRARRSWRRPVVGFDVTVSRTVTKGAPSSGGTASSPTTAPGSGRAPRHRPKEAAEPGAGASARVPGDVARGCPGWAGGMVGTAVLGYQRPAPSRAVVTTSGGTRMYPDDLKYTGARVGAGRGRPGHRRHHPLRPGRPRRHRLRRHPAGRHGGHRRRDLRRGRVHQVGVRHLQPGHGHDRRAQRRARQEPRADQHRPVRAGLAGRDRAHRPGRSIS